MIRNEPSFLNRETELRRLQSLLQDGKGLLLHGPAGIGKSSLLAELHRRSDQNARSLAFTPGTLTPTPWLRQVLLTLTSQSHLSTVLHRLGLRRNSGSAEAEAALARKSAAALRLLLIDVLKEGCYAVVLDPVSFVSRGFYELLCDLERISKTPLVLSARSPHMEVIGYASRFAWPREQQLALGPLPAQEAEGLFDTTVAAWGRQPANLEDFRNHVLRYAGGNPGTLLGLLRMARNARYWSDDSLKSHVLTVDFNLRGYTRLAEEASWKS